MSVFRRSPGFENDDDLSCGVCGTPLLNRKSTCPKCGFNPSKGAPPMPRQAPVDDAQQGGSSPTAVTYATTTAQSVMGQQGAYPSVSKQDDLVTSTMIFMAGFGFVFAMVNLFVSGFGLEDIWHSVITTMVSVGLLGLRRLILGR